MGLDIVELMMEIEDSFSIKIPDDEASQMRTVGDVHKYILANSKLDFNSSICLSSVTFRTLRRAAMSLGVKDRLRPGDLTLRMLPNSDRRGFWTRLENCARLKLPKLRRPQWMMTIATIVVLILASWMAFIAYRFTQSHIAAAGAAVGTSILSGSILAMSTVPFAVLPANNFTTLRGLTECVLGLNFKTLAERHEGTHANDVWMALRAIIVEHLGVSPDVVTPTASFVRDLGCD